MERMAGATATADKLSSRSGARASSRPAPREAQQARCDAPAGSGFRGRCCQRGLGLLETMLIIMLIGGAVLAGYAWLRSGVATQQAEQQANLLDEADRALAGFAAGRYRLPCPDTDGDGYENCAGGAQHGWLPYRTLGLEASDARVGRGPLRYLVNRAGIDLAAASNRFEPHKWDGSTHAFGAINGLDFCAALSGLASAAPPGGAAVTDGVSRRGIAYALAHPGPADADGDGDPFDARNTGAGAEMELPERGASAAAYDDRVLARAPAGLFWDAQCERVTASVDALSLAASAVEEVNSQMLWTTVTAGVLTGVSAMRIGIQVYKLIKAGKAMAAAVATMTAAAAGLNAAIAGCAAIVGCAEIPVMAAAVAASAAAIAAAGAAIVANVAAIVSHSGALTMTLIAAIMAGVDLSGIGNVDLSAAVNAALAAAEDMEAKAVAARSEADAAAAAAAAADTVQANAWTALIDTAHAIVQAANEATTPPGTLGPSSLDSYLIAVKDKAQSLNQAELDYSQARADTEVAEKRRNSLLDGVDEAQAAYDAETDPDKKQKLLEALNDVQAQLNAAEVDLTGKQAAEATARAQRDVAQSQYDAARQSAIDAFRIQVCEDQCWYHDGRATITTRIDAFFNAYRDWFGKQDAADKSEAAADEAEAAAARARAAYNDLKSIADGEAPSGSAVGVWNGATAILEAADTKGALR